MSNPITGQETGKNEPENPSRLGELDLLREKTAHLILFFSWQRGKYRVLLSHDCGAFNVEQGASITEGEGWNKFEKYLTAASWISVRSFKRTPSSLI